MSNRTGLPKIPLTPIPEMDSTPHVNEYVEGLGYKVGGGIIDKDNKLLTLDHELGKFSIYTIPKLTNDPVTTIFINKNDRTDTTVRLSLDSSTVPQACNYVVGNISHVYFTIHFKLIEPGKVEISFYSKEASPDSIPHLAAES